MQSPNPTSRDASARPVRTCVGCRERAPRAELVRVVAIDDGSSAVLMPDLRRSAGGRGAHLHPSTACLDLAVRRKAFVRALRLTGPCDTAQVGAYLGAHEARTTTTAGRTPRDQPEERP